MSPGIILYTHKRRANVVGATKRSDEWRIPRLKWNELLKLRLLFALLNDLGHPFCSSWTFLFLVFGHLFFGLLVEAGDVLSNSGANAVVLEF